MIKHMHKNIRAKAKTFLPFTDFNMEHKSYKPHRNKLLYPTMMGI